MACAQWIDEVLRREFPEDDRSRTVASINLALVFATADESGIPDVNKTSIERVGNMVRRGLEYRKAKRLEGAIASLAVALATVKEGVGYTPER